MIGMTLSHYEITSPLGKGGMGEVYRAKDQKLGRDVAIKVLDQHVCTARSLRPAETIVLSRWSEEP